jgi:hypothetical protein
VICTDLAGIRPGTKLIENNYPTKGKKNKDDVFENKYKMERTPFCL